MNPIPDTSVISESANGAAQAGAWGEKEMDREIALLQAHLSEGKINCAIDRAMEALRSIDDATDEISSKQLNRDIDEELRQCYLDYAMHVVATRCISSKEATGTLRCLVGRASAYIKRFASRLAAAKAIKAIDAASAVLFQKLRTSADSAFYGLPLFADGPELNEYRHRYR